MGRNSFQKGIEEKADKQIECQVMLSNRAVKEPVTAHLRLLYQMLTFLKHLKETAPKQQHLKGA